VAGNVKLTVQLQAQDRATKVIRATHKANEKLIDSMIKAGAAQTRLGTKVAMAIRGQGKYRAALIRTADAASKWGKRLGSMKAAVGALAGAMAVRAFSDFVVAGEKAANIAIRFAQAVPGATKALTEAKGATAGLVEATDLQVVMNRFARLGVPVKTTTRLLELATKAAIDQGRGVLEVAKVIESSLKGRTTGLVEIGVNLDKITGLTEDYAAATGVSVGELDEMDRRLKVALPAALKALGEQFDDVDLRDFNLKMQQTRTVLGDFVSDVQENAAEAWGDILTASFSPGSIPELVADLAAASAEFERASAWRAKFKEGTGAAEDMAKAMRGAAGDASAALNHVSQALAGMRPEDKISAFDRLQGAMTGMTGKVRRQISALFDLEDAYNAVGVAALHAAEDARPSGAFAMAPGAGPTAAAAASLAEAEARRAAARAAPRRRGGGGPSASARAAAAAAAAHEAATERLGAMRRQLAVMSEQNELARARLKYDHVLLKIKREAAAITDDDLRANTETVMGAKALIGFEKERDAILAKRAGAADAAARALEDARRALAIAMAATDQDVIRLELQQRIADIEASGLDAAAQALMIEVARTESAARRADIEAQNRDEMIATFSGGFSAAFADGAEIMGQLDRELSALGRPERYQNISAGFAALSVSVGPAIKSFADLATTSASSGDKIASGVAQGLGALGPAVAGFVSGVKEQAVVMGLFEAAQAVAWSFVDIPQAISHAVASGMFFAMAGVAAAQPTTPGVAAATGGTAVGFSGGGGDTGPGTVVVNIGEGLVFGRPSEIGRAVAERMNSMSGTGMEATAF
jgi:hypothetical protein